MADFRPHYFAMSALVDEDFPIKEKLLKVGALKRFEEDLTEYVMGKEQEREAYSQYYLVQYNSTSKKTEVIHMGSQLGEDERDLQVQATDPFTAIQNFQKLGFEQVLERQVKSTTYRMKGFDFHLLNPVEGPSFLEIAKNVTSQADQDHSRETMVKIFTSLGISTGNLFQGTALQSLLKVMLEQSPEPIEDVEGGLDSGELPSEEDVTDLEQEEGKGDNNPLF